MYGDTELDAYGVVQDADAADGAGVALTVEDEYGGNAERVDSCTRAVMSHFMGAAMVAAPYTVPSYCPVRAHTHLVDVTATVPNVYACNFCGAGVVFSMGDAMRSGGFDVTPNTYDAPVERAMRRMLDVFPTGFPVAARLSVSAENASSTAEPYISFVASLRAPGTLYASSAPGVWATPYAPQREHDVGCVIHAAVLANMDTAVDAARATGVVPAWDDDACVVADVASRAYPAWRLRGARARTVGDTHVVVPRDDAAEVPPQPPSEWRTWSARVVRRFDLDDTTMYTASVRLIIALQVSY